MSLAYRAKMSVRNASIVVRLIRRELSSGGWFRDPAMWTRGMLSWRRAYYPFDRFPFDAFLNDWETEARLGQINAPEAREALQNKLFFHYALEARGLANVGPALLGTVSSGTFHPHRANGQGATLAPGEQAMLKPIGGRGGHGVRAVDSLDDLPPKGLYVVERRVAQHEYAATIFPGSVNTVRVVTMYDGEGPFVAGVVHRFGTRASAPVDNVGSGGMSVHIDAATGRLGWAQRGKRLRDVARYDVHPDSGARIEGAQVACWNEVKELALTLAEQFPGILFSGWDIVVTPEGPRVLEGNGGIPSMELHQAHEPLLLNPRAVRFLDRHGALVGRHGARVRRGHGVRPASG